MTTATLRKLGGSTVIALPPALLNAINVIAGDSLRITLVGGEIRLKPVARKKYDLNMLLDKYEASMQESTDSSKDDEWLNDEPVGKELI